MLRLLVLGLALLAATATASAQEDVLLIGGLFAESGPQANIGTPSKLVAQMAVADLNAKGGVLGKKIKLITYDTQSQTDIALRQVRQLIESDKVFTVIGPTSTTEGMAIKKHTEQAGFPMLMTVGGDAVVAGGKFGPFDWTFKIPQRTTTAVERTFMYLKEKGLTKVAAMVAKDGFGADGAAAMKELAPKYGITIVAEESFDNKLTDFSAEVFKMVMAKPQALIVWSVGPAGAVIAKNVQALPGATGEKPLLVMNHGLPDPKFIEQAGPAAEGVVMAGTKVLTADQLPDSDPQKPVIQQFVKQYKDQGLDAKFPLNAHSGYAYDAMLFLKEGLTKAGKIDAAAFRDGLQDVKNLVGISGVFNLSKEDHNGLGVDSLVMLKVEGGKFTIAK